MNSQTIAGLLLALSACVGSSEQIGPARTPDVTYVTVTSAELSAATTKPATEHESRAYETIGDPQALGLVIALDKGFIEEGTLAAARATDPRVKKFAGLMVHDHQTMLDRNRFLARQNNVAPAETDKSRQLRSESQQRLHELEQLNGMSFDTQYVFDQVAGHIEALVVIDTKILPNLKTSDLKTQAEKDKARMSHHLAEARDLQRHLTPSYAMR